VQCGPRAILMRGDYTNFQRSDQALSLADPASDEVYELQAGEEACSARSAAGLYMKRHFMNHPLRLHGRPHHDFRHLTRSGGDQWAYS
jgi:hypothetical protein